MEAKAIADSAGLMTPLRRTPASFLANALDQLASSTSSACKAG